MRWMWRRSPLLFLLAAVVCGCSRGPRRIVPPDVDPATAADEAIGLYDKNGDQKLNQDELTSCPALLSKLSAYDQDGDKAISRDEIFQRISERRKHRVGLQCVKCRVMLDGRPLKGAQVVFEPEPYLGDEIKTAVGTTNAGGQTPVAIPPEELPEEQRKLNALHVGAYKVRITHPEIELPPQYNSETTLGYETESGTSYAQFELEGKGETVAPVWTSHLALTICPTHSTFAPSRRFA